MEDFVEKHRKQIRTILCTALAVGCLLLFPVAFLILYIDAIPFIIKICAVALILICTFKWQWIAKGISLLGKGINTIVPPDKPEDPATTVTVTDLTDGKYSGKAIEENDE